MTMTSDAAAVMVGEQAIEQIRRTGFEEAWKDPDRNAGIPLQHQWMIVL